VILGFDTATPSTAVALWAPDSPARELRDDPPPGERPNHASRLLALVEEVVDTWDAVERIAVGVGPGGFTGLRIGIATARALAQANEIPVVGVSSLAALAAGAGEAVAAGAGVTRPAGGRPPYVVAVIDARRGEVFAAGPGFGPAAMSPAALAERIEPGSMAVGDGAVRFRAELERAGAAVPVDDSPLHRVSALQICRLGAEGDPGDRDALLPDYRREPDAKPPRLP
jgi:tRNA threonylcarbamoyladenosine biosynthesis protein TsaB